MSYGLHCTVCNNRFESRESWIAHLLTEAHQCLARQECLQWGQEERKCVVVIFSDKPIANKATSMLEHFSKKDLDTIVTDFVWWPGRDKVGLLQFESRLKVKQILNGLGGMELQLSDCTAQLKDAISYFDLEWKELICSETVTEKEQHSGFTALERKPKLLQNGNVVEDMETIGIGVSNNKHDMILEETETLARQLPQAIVSEGLGAVVVNGEPALVNLAPHPRATVKKASPWLLRAAAEFTDLCKSVEISDEGYGRLLDVINGVRKILGVEYEVNMFRNSVLKLRNPGRDVLLIHAMKKMHDERSLDTLEEDVILQRQLLDTLSGRTALPGFQKEEGEMEGTIYVHPLSGLRFAITTNPLRNVEVEMSRLLKYFCTFDPSVKLLFSLVYRWAQIHDIHLAETNIPCSIQHSNVPEPAALDWLIILFLSRKRVIPTVREVYEHAGSCDENESDISFNADPSFVQEWRNLNGKHLYGDPNEPECFKSVLILLQRFFKMFHEIWSNERKMVLNPKDGEYFPCDEFFKSQCETKMSSVEISLLQKFRKEDAKIFMIHPLCITWRLSLSDKTILEHAEIVKETYKRIRKLMKQYERREILCKDLDIEKALVGPQVDDVDVGQRQRQSNRGRKMPRLKGLTKPERKKVMKEYYVKCSRLPRMKQLNKKIKHKREA